VKVTLQDGQSLDIQQENIEALQQLFPELVRDGKVNFDVFRQVFGDVGVLEEGEEKFGLNWHGKKKARQNAFTPSLGTLLPCPEESVDWDTTQNLFIEGDNLEVLKLLQKSYANKVKMIYIDPPYNTGKEFIYPDRFQENLDTYLNYTGQVNEEGLRLSSDTETQGRKHTAWLNMIYPRLSLAKALLRKDGVIFISIDDGEVANLKNIMSEIFGEENFLANLIWQKKFAPQNDAKFFSENHEHILVYAKNYHEFQIGLLPRSDEADSRYKNLDNDARGLWASGDMTRAEYRPNDYYPIISPKTGKVFYPPEGNSWRRPKEIVEELIKDNRIWFGEDGNNFPRAKRFLTEVKQGITPQTIWERKDVGDTQEGKKFIKQYFNNSSVFETPKPPRLIEKMLRVANVDDGDLILDFFAGSCSTAEAVMNYEKKLKFIMVQLPELCLEKSEPFKAGFKNIAEIGKERIRRSLQSVSTKSNGFKCFKLSSSNFRIWNSNVIDLEDSLDLNQNHILDGRTELDVLYELLLKRGIDLATPIEKREINSKTLYSIGYGAVFACLDDSILATDTDVITSAIIEWHKELAPSNDTHIFFKDSAFQDDVVKTNLAAILEQNGLKHVRSL
jgi:adenine-specific DNA-methyltransferase